MNRRMSGRVWSKACRLAPVGLAVCLWSAEAVAEPAGGPPWLRAEGPRIVNDRGQTVLLRGVNLGGWFVEEMWMMPFQTRPPEGSNLPPVRDHVSLWRTLETRLGAEAARRIRTAFREAWIAEADFDRIRTAGFNHVRLPFLYDLIDEPEGWTWLDRAVAWAGSRGLYVVLDLHSAPGRQSKDHHSGEEGVNRFFQGEQYVKHAEIVWNRIAMRYRDRSAVAAYDLVNEPMGAPDNPTLYGAQGRLYQAVRRADARHMVMFEDGYKGAEHMPDPAASGWSNVVYSVHSYKFDARSADDHLRHLDGLLSTLRKVQPAHRVPFYIGEFNLEPRGTPDLLRRFIGALEKDGHSWALWTYKTLMRRGSGPSSMWGWIRRPTPLPAPLDPFRDSEAQMLEKIRQVRSETLEVHPGLDGIFAVPK